MSDSKDYRRPNEEWVCGWKRRGFKCPKGPSVEGQCQKSGVCQPVMKDGGYICTRNGGACKEGPLPTGACAHSYPPCSPRRSLKANRRLVTVGVVTLVFGFLLFQLGGLKANEVFYNPGELSFQHSSSVSQCTACHQNAHEDSAPLAWVFGGEHRQADSSKCLNCHSMGEHAFSAHSLPADHLKEITAKMGGGEPDSKSQNISCSQCHKEHRGSQFDLTEMTKQQCQTCHTQKFDSFADGHPEFTNYPFGQRVHILFDHTSHFSKHFEKAEKASEISCQTCHAPSSSGSKMIVVGYEQACSQCHDDQIRGESASEKGLVFFRLPGLDVETLRNKGIAVGQWPEYAEGGLTAFTKFLLSKDDELKEIISELEENEIELEDLSDVDGKTLKKVGKLVWAVKRLLVEMVENGSETIGEVIDDRMGDDVNPAMKAGMISSLPVEVVRAASQRWFRNLASEVKQNKAGQRVETQKVPAPTEEIEDEDLMASGGWYRDNEGFAIRYRPVGHGDNFLKSWLTVAARQSNELPSAKAVLDNLSERSGTPGMCAKCHGIENLTPEMTVVHWNATKEKAGKQDFVRFSHSSHLNLIKENGCFTCHSMNEKAEFEKVFESHDPSAFESNFMSISKSKCVQCHQSEKVNDSCVTCHNYHIGDFFTSEAKMKNVRTSMGQETPAEPAAAEAAPEGEGEKSAEAPAKEENKETKSDSEEDDADDE